MNIYTRTGDKGYTSLIGGKRVSKSDLRIETYGTIDELISYIGLVRDQKVSEKIREELISIQEKLMICASLLATDSEEGESDLPNLSDEDVVHLEHMIDAIERELLPLHSLILPGGHSAVSFCHIARCVCRRSERHIIRLNEGGKVDALIIRYFNRLSDFLFVLARKLSKDFGIKEEMWQPKK